MTKRKIMIGAALIGAVAGLGTLSNMVSFPASARAIADDKPVVVELFTSQGCSDCPPADVVLAKLSSDANIIVISRPVNYWDNLGWKDTLARQGNTDLQRAYASRGGVGSGVYTPQAMVQGVYGAVGSSEGSLRGLIGQARSLPGAMVTVSASSDGGRRIALAGGLPRPVIIKILALRSSVAVRIGSGENGGSNVRYTNVVVGEHDLAGSGAHAGITVPARYLHEGGADRAAVIVQQGNAGPILAARIL